ncbi:MAG: hypothetical protein ACJAVN_001181 [Roseivirga sp.]|jgi:hypothetical protein
MKQIKSYIFILFSVLLFANCQPDIETVPIVNETKRRVVKAEDIPKVTSTLLGKLGLSNGTQRLAMNSSDVQSEFEIDWDKILQLIDSTGGQTYTFRISDNDNDPRTFHNIVLRFNEFGDAYTPFVMKYEMSEGFFEEYMKTGTMRNFKGRITQIPLAVVGTSTENGANIGPDTPRLITENPDCPGVTLEATNSSGSSGGPGGLTTTTTWTTLGGSTTNEVCDVYEVWLPYDHYDGEGNYTYSDEIFLGISIECYTTTVDHTEVGASPNCETGPGEIPVIQPEDRLLELNLALKQDSTLLINLSCSELAKWQEVSSHVPPQSVVNKISALRSSYPNLKALFTGNFDMQTLKEAKGTVLNMDYFLVKINQLPSGCTAEEFLQHIRKNLNSFIDTQYSSFSPYDASNTGYDEAQAWNSDNPLGSILHIEIPMDEGSVICSDFSSDSWKFTTISAPYDWTHPVSGTREFGFTRNDDGSYEFYTRGVDRVTQSLNEILGSKATFNGADNLWLSLQEGIRQFVNENGGTIEIGEPIIGRPNYSDIIDFLAGKKSLSDIGCKN